MSIYTKTGDEGKTSLLSGERVFKDCITLRVVGELDELNSVLGITSFLFKDNTLLATLKMGSDVFLIQIQKDLFKLGSELAGLQNGIGTINCTDNCTDNFLNEKDIIKLEKEIDAMWAEMPELKNFILPGGSLVGAYLHQARTICRRVERELVSLGKEKKIRSDVYKYLNRLSDFLFVLARYLNFKLKVEERVV